MAMKKDLQMEWQAPNANMASGNGRKMEIEYAPNVECLNPTHYPVPVPFINPKNATVFTVAPDLYTRRSSKMLLH